MDLLKKFRLYNNLMKINLHIIYLEYYSIF